VLIRGHVLKVELRRARSARQSAPVSRYSSRGEDTGRIRATLFVKNLLDKQAFTAVNAITLDRNSPLYSVAVIQALPFGLSVATRV
jgi:hypothetical protein